MEDLIHINFMIAYLMLSNRSFSYSKEFLIEQLNNLDDMPISEKDKDSYRNLLNTRITECLSDKEVL